MSENVELDIKEIEQEVSLVDGEKPEAKAAKAKKAKEAKAKKAKAAKAKKAKKAKEAKAKAAQAKAEQAKAEQAKAAKAKKLQIWLEEEEKSKKELEKLMYENEKNIEKSIGIMKETVIIAKFHNQMQNIIHKKTEKSRVVYQNRSKKRPTVIQNNFQMKLF